MHRRNVIVVIVCATAVATVDIKFANRVRKLTSVVARIEDRNAVRCKCYRAALKVAASYIMGSPAAATNDINTYTVGASYAIDAANTIGLNYSKNNAAQAASIVNVTASHALSKATSLYAFYNNTKNSALSSYYNTSGDNAYGIGITKNF